MKGFDATNGSEFFCLKNPNKAVYTSICWDQQELYIADELGYLGVLNVYMEKPLIWKKIVKEKIIKIEITPVTKVLMVMSEKAIRAYRIRKGLKT